MKRIAILLVASVTLNAAEQVPASPLFVSPSTPTPELAFLVEERVKELLNIEQLPDGTVTSYQEFFYFKLPLIQKKLARVKERKERKDASLQQEIEQKIALISAGLELINFLPCVKSNSPSATIAEKRTRFALLKECLEKRLTTPTERPGSCPTASPDRSSPIKFQRYRSATSSSLSEQ